MINLGWSYDQSEDDPAIISTMCDSFIRPVWERIIREHAEMPWLIVYSAVACRYTDGLYLKHVCSHGRTLYWTTVVWYLEHVCSHGRTV